MSQSHSETRRSVSAFHIALSLAVLKSKPPELSVREYLSKLPSQIQAGERHGIYSSEHEYLDAVAHWKDRFLDAQTEILHLQKRLVQLERETVALKDGFQRSDVVEAPQRNGRKRKPNSSLDSSGKSRKRTEESRNSDNGYESFEKGLDDEFDVLGTTSYGTATVCHVWHAHESYKKRHSDPSILAYHLTRTSYNLTQHLAVVAKNCRERQLRILKEQNQAARDIGTAIIEKELSRTQRAAGRIFISLLHGLATLSDAQRDSITPRQSAVIYSYAQGFDTILTVISTTLALHVNGTEDGESIGDRKPKQKAKPGKDRSVEVVSSSLNTLLLAIIGSLDPKQRSHGALFEAILYFILSRVGSHLFFFTFNHERSETVDGDIAVPFPPCHSEAGVSDSAAPVVKQRVAIMEGKHLIQLLARAMTLAPSFLGSNLYPSATTRLSRASGMVNRASASKPSAIKSALTLLARQKLQHTLINAMFGEDDAQNEFTERLTKPKPFPPIAAPPNVDDKDVSAWFSEQVWRLVGWEVLGRDEDLL